MFYEEIVNEENEEKADLEMMIVIATRVAFHSDKKGFKEYFDEYKRLKEDARIQRLIDAGVKFNGTTINQEKR